MCKSGFGVWEFRFRVCLWALGMEAVVRGFRLEPHPVIAHGVTIAHAVVTGAEDTVGVVVVTRAENAVGVALPACQVQVVDAIPKSAPSKKQALLLKSTEAIAVGFSAEPKVSVEPKVARRGVKTGGVLDHRRRRSRCTRRA